MDDPKYCAQSSADWNIFFLIGTSSSVKKESGHVTRFFAVISVMRHCRFCQIRFKFASTSSKEILFALEN